MRMFTEEIRHNLKKPLFWILSAGIGFMKFLAIFAQDPGALHDMLSGNRYFTEITYYEGYRIAWASFLSYVIPALCAYAAAGDVTEDIRYGRYPYLLPRSGSRTYVISRVGALCASAFISTAAGNLFFYALMLLLGFPAVPAGFSLMGVNLIDRGHGGLFLLMATVEFSLFCVFVSIVTMLVSLFIRDRKIVTVFPIIFMYLIDRVLYFRSGPFYNSDKWLTPKYVYLMYGWWQADEEWIRFLYMIFYTAVSAAVSAAILYAYVQRRRHE